MSRDNSRIGIVDNTDMNNKVPVVDRDKVVGNKVGCNMDDIGIAVHGKAGIDFEDMDIVVAVVVVAVVIVVRFWVAVE
jgi:hypothetical protein